MSVVSFGALTFVAQLVGIAFAGWILLLVVARLAAGSMSRRRGAAPELSLLATRWRDATAARLFSAESLAAWAARAPPSRSPAGNAFQPAPASTRRRVVRRRRSRSPIDLP